jgi:hypothetical protein
MGGNQGRLEIAAEGGADRRSAAPLPQGGYGPLVWHLAHSVPRLDAQPRREGHDSGDGVGS